MHRSATSDKTQPAIFIGYLVFRYHLCIFALSLSYNKYDQQMCVLIAIKMI